MNTIETNSAQSAAKIHEEKKRETRLGLAGDMIERGLQYRFDELHLLLIQVEDSKLIHKGAEAHCARSITELLVEAEALSDALGEAFPLSRSGAARNLVQSRCHSLVEEVEFYRQEQFWTKQDRASLLAAEDLIARMFKLYADVELWLLGIDRVQPAYRVERRERAPKHTENSFQGV